MNYLKQHANGHLSVTVTGDLDQAVGAMFADLCATASPGTAVSIDCSGIQRVNSLGMRDWLRGIANLREGRHVTLSGCTPTLLDIATMVPGLLAGCEIRSFLALYRCEECSREGLQTIGIEQGILQLPREIRCSRCAGQLRPHEDFEEDVALVLSLPLSA